MEQLPTVASLTAASMLKSEKQPPLLACLITLSAHSTILAKLNLKFNVKSILLYCNFNRPQVCVNRCLRKIMYILSRTCSKRRCATTG